MSRIEFNQQMVRLIGTFGKTYFPEERMLLIWREIQWFSQPWFEKLVDYFIGDFRQAPLLPDFRDAIARVREQEYCVLKKQHSEEALNWSQTYGVEEVSRICEFIRRRMDGGVSDQDYLIFQDNLKSTGKLQIAQ